jgi:2,3-bisphosphoglycerate-independent phosphoglycerate mutase
LKRKSAIVFLGDGMADEPVAELGGRTPLQVAHVPGMDAIARRGRSGTLLTLPEGFPTSSDVANMSVLGCSLKREFCGRGVLEAASRQIPLDAQSVAFRCNLINIDAGNRITDYSSGQIEQSHATALMDFLDQRLGAAHRRFHHGVSYRNLLVFQGLAYSDKVHCFKPDDHVGEETTALLPTAMAPEARQTADELRQLMTAAAAILPAAPANRQAQAAGRMIANAIWPWSPGKAGTMRTLRERHGISGAVISAVDTIRGLGRCLGMEVIHVPGATGYIDTNYGGKAEAAIEAARNHDLVYVHVEGTDEVSHMRDLRLKIKAIEDFDRQIIVPVMKACGDAATYVVLPDHPVPVRLGKHTRTPVPVAVCGPGIEPDSVQEYNEMAAPRGALGRLAGEQLMDFLFPRAP